MSFSTTDVEQKLAGSPWQFGECTFFGLFPLLLSCASNRAFKLCREMFTSLYIHRLLQYDSLQYLLPGRYLVVSYPRPLSHCL